MLGWVGGQGGVGLALTCQDFGRWRFPEIVVICSPWVSNPAEHFFPQTNSGRWHQGVTVLGHAEDPGCTL